MSHWPDALKWLVLLGLLFPLIVCGAGHWTDRVTFSLGKNRVKSHIVVKGNEVTIHRYYDKPFEGGARALSFRQEDISVYQFDCRTKEVALLNFEVMKPSAKKIDSSASLYWKAATGPEFSSVFKTHCQTAIKIAPVLNPDEWLKESA